MKKYILFIIAAMMLTACRRQPRPIQYETVAIDSTATERNLASDNPSWQNDEGAIMIPDEGSPEADGEISEEDLENIFAGEDIGKY